MQKATSRASGLDIVRLHPFKDGGINVTEFLEWNSWFKKCFFLVKLGGVDGRYNKSDQCHNKDESKGQLTAMDDKICVT